ncbi:MAG: hypothetical protein KA521_04410 [Crocinitomicaceae bacterium]|nr:hypothetical protein [Crocinitomicaceae bacterium]
MFFTARARKKKGLTDPVELIPFKNQNLRDKATPAEKVIAPPIRQAAPIPIVEQKIATVPTGQLNTSTLSIKHLVQQKEESAISNGTSVENLPMNDYSFDQVKMLWRRFAFEMKERGMETFYNAMIKREPNRKEQDSYTMDVDNQIQVDYITPHLQDLNQFFRKELKNYAFTISIEQTGNPEEEIKFLTGKDKFAAMARKNPNIHTLKTLFNLDIEY